MKRIPNHDRGQGRVRLAAGVDRYSPWWWILPILVLLILSPLHGVLAAPRRPAFSVRPESDPNKFVLNVLQNEIQAEQDDHSLWTYQDLKKDHGKEKLFIVCQTKQGNIERLIAIDGKPLSPDEEQREDRRLENLVAHPHQMAQEQKKQKEDGEQAQQLLRMFPEAFQFEYAGTQGDVVNLRFTPNPKFRPSTRPQQVFHQMEGTLRLDGHAGRLAAINGRLTSEVKFGGGWLGHLDKGGTFAVQQREVGSGYWEITAMRVQMNGRVLFFKSISVQQDETYSDFQLVPEDTSLQRAVELVKRNDASHSAALR
jgi:hypothetical protein